MAKTIPKVDRLAYSVKEVSYMLNVSVETIYELIRQQKIPFLTLGEKRVVIPIELFNDWFNSQIIKKGG